MKMDADKKYFVEDIGYFENGLYYEFDTFNADYPIGYLDGENFIYGIVKSNKTGPNIAGKLEGDYIIRTKDGFKLKIRSES